MCRKPRQRHDDEPLAVALEQSEPLELVERVADIEVDVDAEGRAQPVLDTPIELGGDWRRSRFMQEMIGEERLFDLLLFSGADDVLDPYARVIRAELACGLRDDLAQAIGDTLDAREGVSLV